MALAEFTWMNCLVETQYPESSVRVQFGNSYTFTAEPDAPDQRKFILSYEGFKYYTNPDGTVDVSTNAAINNMASLEAFYNTHKQWKSFNFTHPVSTIGLVVCKFSKPLIVPKGLKGGNGTLEPFQIELIEQP